MTGFWSASVNPTTMGTTFYRKITGVNTSAKTVEIDIPTRYYMKTRDNARVYSEVENYAIYSIADILYQNRKMNTVAGHNFLYEKILLSVNPAYKIVDYDWGNIIVGA